MTDTINFAPEEEAKLHQEVLREELQDRAEAITGIQRGLQAFEEGRFRRFSEFEAEQRMKYCLPVGDTQITN
jgi:hypothetical protein